MQKKNNQNFKKIEKVMFKQLIVVVVGSVILGTLINYSLGIMFLLMFILAAIMKIELEVLKHGSRRNN